MVKEVLVEADIEAGRKLVDLLRHNRLTILAVQWVKRFTYMQLAIVTPQVRTLGELKLYTRLQKLLDPAGPLTLDDVWFISPKTELGKRLAS